MSKKTPIANDSLPKILEMDVESLTDKKEIKTY